ncbi:fructosyl amino acid oxidasesarcosine oxidase, putative [Talaromyces stipitatus ATCC 10500]|uniref:Fructosyl amino acid oxidasesarcosine oxidase, putative n=1 Tax=Talaromyces stipitatus (strain ATCC 10500 / CBS 375.48 / QM 6759 / NRRL 1006) TaxID=441959 RepID=B8M6Q9_TALSN|nr:fructosyl amino acid oxidasesarcosine oxidase, putative [Talaromyces stipitatus ATCC 10500]EED19521.1 fructosyl amino acid oxidasesarcosine oxidase, putative [Talaromyces stipitatus ATCC 10500]
MELPDNILIVGGGVFGLSTALSLSERHPNKQITLLEASPTIPNPHGSSVDTSRIIRADYSNPAYTKLAAAGIKKWRNTEWGHEGRYTENGLALVYTEGNFDSENYTRKSYENVKKLLEEEGEGSESIAEKVVYLPDKAALEKVVPRYAAGMNISGGYFNRGSGWGDAEAGVRFAKKKLDEMAKVVVRHGEVERLLFDETSSSSSSASQRRVTGAILKDTANGTTSTITADLIILATGAATGRLVDLRGIVDATGQVLAYINITDEEQAQLAHMPTILSFSTGMFIIPPRNNLLKIARHAYGYLNPSDVPVPGSSQTMRVSLPVHDLPIPAEGERACRQALREMLPAFAERPFARTRICWYSDTPTGDFLITYHPSHPNLFLATGGSGHGYKFFPVLGDQIVNALEGRLDPELQRLWKWPDQQEQREGSMEREGVKFVVTRDGSRSGKVGMILKDELARSSRL